MMKRILFFLLPVCLFMAGGCLDEQGGGAGGKTRLITMDYGLLHHLQEADFAFTRPRDFTFEDMFRRREVEIGGTRRFSLCMYPDASVSFDVRLLQNPRLSFGIGLLPRGGHLAGDGVTFTVAIRQTDGEETMLYRKHLDRAGPEEKARWVDAVVDLGPYAGRSARLTLGVGSGPRGDDLDDYAVWSLPVIQQRDLVSLRTRGKDPPNIILITADTLRADHLGCYGNTRVETPALDGLARAGVLFEQVYTAANNTNPSHMSILASLTPRAHGVYTNHHRLQDRFRILSQIFQDQGYRTGAILSAPWLSHRVTGLNRGFDEFHEAEQTKRAAFTTAEAIEFVTRRRDTPFFLWVHYFDPHTRYDPPPPFASRRAAGREPGPGEKTLLEKHAWFEGKQHIYEPWLAGVVDRAYPEGQYRGEVNYLDHALQNLLLRLDELALSSHTVVAFTADHGELLGEHGIFYAHKGLWEPSVRVPLLVRYPGRLPAGLRIESVVRTLDIAPTLMALAGLSPDSKSQMQGLSLLPLVEGAETVQRAAVMEHADEIATAIRRGDWKLIVTHRKSPFLLKGRALYHLGRDPDEKINLYGREPVIAAELEVLLEEWQAKHRKTSAFSGDISDGMKEKLKAMGYLEE